MSLLEERIKRAKRPSKINIVESPLNISTSPQRRPRSPERPNDETNNVEHEHEIEEDDIPAVT